MKLIRLLIAAFLLLPSVALAQLDPSTHDPVPLYYVPFQALNGANWTQGISNDGAVADEATELVGSITSGISGVPSFNAATMTPGTERRVPLAAAGGTLGLAGTSDRVLRHDSFSYANTIHQNRKCWVIAFWESNAAQVNSRALIDSTNLANPDGTSAQGFSLRSQQFNNGGSAGGIYRKKTGAIPRFLIKNAGDKPIVDLPMEEDLDAASVAVHRAEIYVDPDELCHARLDDGRKTYARVIGDAGSGNASFRVFITNRNSFSTEWQGKLIALGVYPEYPGDEARQEWLDAAFGVLGTLGTLSGSSEARVGEHHINFSRDQAGMPYCHWFNKQRISGVSPTSQNEEGYNAVFADGESTDYLNSGNNWVGGPHRNETLSSATVSIDGAAPVAYSTGQIYEGNSSVRVVRNTAMGVSFDQTETLTLTRRAMRVNTVLTRKNDARAINPLYFRSSRDNDYQDFLAFNAAGEIVHDSAVTASDFECDAGVIAIAQWSPLAGVMALTTVIKGRELNFTTLILYSALNSRRIYHRLNAGGGSDIPTGTGSVEFETLSKFYETTAEDWEALAQSEVLKILNPAKGRPRLGLGIDLKLGAIERQWNPLARVGFSTEFCLAP